ncbi:MULTISPECIES: site-specific integrase [unclassified Bradyrhizobium]|uniref:site-specific integrase n=1 Tax=unclassified Bradyrhizobium TaxID=2631580 RepID=UPI0029160127|nr:MULTISPECIES: site-specific integrase [unclassified Bradyrhizobium]
MPLKLKPPRKGKTPNYSIRGTYLGVHVDRTAGTADKAVAERLRKGIQKSIERGEYQKPAAVEPPREPTFADAALAYLKAGGAPNYIERIIKDQSAHSLRDRKLAEIDQIAIDNAARSVYPEAPATTLNRQFYTPVSAILKHAGIERKIKRPKGWRGSKATSWLDPEPAFAVIREAFAIEPEFGLLCLTLLYTGMRLSDPLRARVRDLRLGMALLYIPDTKNGEPRPVHLPPILIEAFKAQPPRQGRPRKADGIKLADGQAGRGRASAGVPWLERPADEKLFRFCKGGRLYDMLDLAMTRAGVSFPKRQGAFHLFCHTYGTWMTHYGELDTYGLTRTGRWKDPDSADRYRHTIASPEARRADLLPVPQQSKERKRA